MPRLFPRLSGVSKPGSPFIPRTPAKKLPWRFHLTLGAAAFLLLTGTGFPEESRGEVEPCSPGKTIRIEMNLAKKWRKQKKTIQGVFEERDENFKARVDFFPFLDPPMNIGIGRCVSAEQGRFAIEQAIAYNGGIDQIIFQKALPEYWVGIGYLKLPERTWVPLEKDGLESLKDPALSTESFQALYKNLSQIKEQAGIFGMPPIPVEPGKP